MSLFETGPVVMTCGIRSLMMDDPSVSEKIEECLERHRNGDWGGAPATGHKHCQMWHWITTEIQLPICLT